MFPSRASSSSSSFSSSSSSSFWPEEMPRIEDIAQIPAKPYSESESEQGYAEEVAAKLVKSFQKTPMLIEQFYKQYELYKRASMNSAAKSNIQGNQLDLLMNPGRLLDMALKNSASIDELDKNLKKIDSVPKKVMSEASKGKLEDLSKQLNIEYFIHFYLIKKHQVSFEHPQRVILNLCGTIAQISKCARNVIENEPSITLAWCSTLIPILDACYSECNSMIEKIINNEVSGFKSDVVSYVKSNLPDFIVLAPQILITLGLIYAKMGNSTVAKFYIKQFDEKTKAIKKRFNITDDASPSDMGKQLELMQQFSTVRDRGQQVKLLQQLLTGENLLLKDDKEQNPTIAQSTETHVSLKRMLKELGVIRLECHTTLTNVSNSSQRLKIYEVKLKTLVVSFQAAKPEQFFSSEDISTALSSSLVLSSSSVTLLDRMQDITKNIKSVSANNALLIKRTNENTADYIDATFACLNELTLNHNRVSASDNIEAAIVMCEEWTKLFSIDYTAEAKDIASEWRKIINTLVQCKHAEDTYVPHYYEPLLKEMAQQTLFDENIGLTSLGSYPGFLSSNFNNKFQSFLYQHPRLEVNESYNFDDFETNIENLTKFKENINIFHFALSKIFNNGTRNFYTEYFVHLLWKNIALANQCITVILKEGEALQSNDFSLYLDMVRQNYVYMNKYFKMYHEILNGVLDLEVSNVSYSFVEKIRPKIFDAFYDLMTAHTDYISCESSQGDSARMSEAIPFCYDALSSLLNDSLILSEEDKAKLVNYTAHLQQLIFRLYVSQLGCLEFESFVQQASQRLPLQKNDLNGISLPEEVTDFWQAYDSYVNQPLTLSALGIQNLLMHNVILQSRVNVYYYALTHLIEQTSPRYAATLTVLFNVCSQLYDNAKRISKNLLNPIEQYKSYLKDLIPQVEKLKNKDHTLQINALKKEIQETQEIQKSKPYSLEEAGAISLKGGKGKPRRNQTTPPPKKGAQAKVTSPPPKSVKLVEDDISVAEPRFISPTCYVPRSSEEIVTGGDFRSPGRPKSAASRGQQSQTSSSASEPALAATSRSRVGADLRSQTSHGASPRMPALTSGSSTSTSQSQKSRSIGWNISPLITTPTVGIKEIQRSEVMSHHPGKKKPGSSSTSKQSQTTSSSHSTASSSSKFINRKSTWRPVLRASLIPSVQSSDTPLSEDIYSGIQASSNSERGNDLIAGLTQKIAALSLEHSLKHMLKIPLKKLDLEGSSEHATFWKRTAKENVTAAEEQPQNSLNIADCFSIQIGTSNIPLNLLDICFKLNAAGFKSFIVGCVLHTDILGAIPNYVEILTNCSREIVDKLFDYQGKSSSSNNELYLLYPGIDIVCSNSKTLKEEALKRVFKWDAIFYCPVTRKLYDPLNAYSSLDRHFHLVKDAYTTFTEDPMQILKGVRSFNSLNMIPTINELALMKLRAPLIAEAPWEIRTNNIKALFLRNYSHAIENYDFLISHQIMPCLFSSDPNEKWYYPKTANFEFPINQFWCNKLHQIYSDVTKGGATTLSSFDQVIALILFIRLQGYRKFKEHEHMLKEGSIDIEKSVAFIHEGLNNTQELIQSIYPDQENRMAIVAAVSAHHHVFNRPPPGMLVRYSASPLTSFSAASHTDAPVAEQTVTSSSHASEASHSAASVEGQRTTTMSSSRAAQATHRARGRGARR